MKATIVGKGQIFKGDSKRTGKPYHMQSLYLTYKKSGVEGTAVKEQAVSFLDLPEPLPVYVVGSQIMLDYDDNGYLLGIEVVSSKA